MSTRLFNSVSLLLIARFVIFRQGNSFAVGAEDGTRITCIALFYMMSFNQLPQCHVCVCLYTYHVQVVVLC